MAKMKKLLSFEVPEEPAGYLELSTEALDDLLSLAVQAAAPIRKKDPEDATDEDVALALELAAVATGVRAAKAAKQKKADDFEAASRVLDPDEPDDAPADDEKSADDEKPAPPKAKTAAPRVGDIAKGEPADVVPADKRKREAVLVAAADVPGFPTGGEYEDLTQLGKAIIARANTYHGATGYHRNGVAVFRRDFDDNLVQFASGSDDDLLQFASRESRLPGGSVANSVMRQVEAGVSLTAAAGWCAPSQTVYDLFELEASTGMVDLPEVQITRGGLRFTPGPDFASIFGGTGYFHQTEAQVIAATVKPCMVVPCPSFTDVRLEIEGVCITGAILQSRGYPEMVARFVRGAMAVHRHKLNQFIIAQLVAGSTTVDLSPHPAAGSVAADDTSATTVLLAHIEMAAVDYKYRHRMPIDATLEAIFPYWTFPVIRADISRRTGILEVNVTDAQIMSWFRARGIRPQFVYDWQDSFAGLGTGPGGATALNQFPQELEFLLFAAGTFVRGSADVITLDTVYDAANLALNQFVALFTEEGVLVAKLGHDARRYIVPFCPTGTSSATTQMNCTA